MLIFLVRLIIILKKLLTAFFVSIIFKPVRIILYFIFYKIIIKVYSAYLYFIKRLGWSKFKDNPWLFLIKQKLGHIIVIMVTILLVYTNLVSKINADPINNPAKKTILASLIENEFNTNEEEKIIEEFFDEEAIISPTQNTYLDNLSSVKNQPAIKINPEEADSQENGIMPDGQALRKPDLVLTQKTKQPRKDIVDYTVTPGDTVSTIAENFAISVSTILWENNLSSYSIIRPGDKLAILPVSGITHKVANGENLEKIADKYRIDRLKIMEINKMTDASKLAISQKLIIPGGSKTGYAKPATNAYSGISIVKNLVNAPNASPVSGNKMNWPTIGHTITQYFSWRHYAIDIANKLGTPVYAADAGTAEYVGWGKGYGNQIVINHGGGKKTRYAHLSQFFISKGQEVEKGETIAAMGSTGHSTGPHVHFEVIINNIKYNPLNYIK